jgi:hypothetical protein
MIFLPYLQCKSCPSHISLPLPIHSETTPRQIAFPWGALSGTFLCPSCMRPNLYWAEDCLWDRAQNTDQHSTSRSLAVHRIDIPCGVEMCPSLLHILAVMPLGSRPVDAMHIAVGMHLVGTLCGNGHPNHGRANDRVIRCTAVSVTEQGDQLDWAT